MPQASETQPLQLQLTPLQISENVCQPIDTPWTDSDKIGFFGGMKTVENKICELVLYPGEPCELLVQLENISRHALALNLEIEGNFPSNWYRVGGEGNELPPGAKMEVVLYFQLDRRFFEDISPDKIGQPLVLDYRGQIQVSYNELSNSTDANEARLGKIYQQFAPFQLFVRPRSLYLKYLPDLYREVDFVGRLLKIFEEAFEPDFNTASTLWAYLHPRTAPEAMLPFLAHWVGWEMTPILSLKKQRDLIAKAIEIYRWRGTRRGLRYYLHLFTDLPLDEHLEEKDKHISILELGGRGFVVGEAGIGEDTIMGGGQPFHFIVCLRYPGDRPLDEKLVRKVIEQEKPAFCTYDLYLEEISRS
ncbi:MULTISPECIES: phage tail protein [Spirulina sp. CCY15215]|uniref:phage tail protein n=1 Tax=Spirulina sp. CCY15215 TaxID=2767591 RepID=UPI001950554B|nr:phage tail protein [Spirulina major]